MACPWSDDRPVVREGREDETSDDRAEGSMRGIRRTITVNPECKSNIWNRKTKH